MVDSEKTSLEDIVFCFADVNFWIGKFAFSEREELKESITQLEDSLGRYRASKANYDGPTAVYDNHINFSLDTFTDLAEVKRIE